ncbi:MAG TPA: DUF502 domain-containing protein [Candidatus Angelobacter sp.]|nr:DUF502 domain-containing protein [Candidatus Angelobacter sp.]
MKKRNVLSRSRGNFFTGLAIVLPAVISVAVLVWLFGTVSNITDILLFFLPHEWTHKNGGEGPMHWYWSLSAIALAVVLITLLGSVARYYFGRKLIELLDRALLRVPLLNKIYGTVKQVNEAFSPGNRSSFKQVVLLEFPRPGQFSVGFVTGEQHQEVQAKTKQKVVSVFVPTTPNPTSGFLVLVPEKELTKLDMTVADGIKFIVSLGAIAPEFAPAKRRS